LGVVEASTDTPGVGFLVDANLSPRVAERSTRPDTTPSRDDAPDGEISRSCTAAAAYSSEAVMSSASRSGKSERI
jgi:hypothetical protein